MNRKKAAVAAVALLVLVVTIGVVLFMMGGNVPSSQNIAVSSVSLDVGGSKRNC